MTTDYGLSLELSFVDSFPCDCDENSFSLFPDEWTCKHFIMELKFNVHAWLEVIK